MDTATQFGISFCSGYGGLDRGIELAGVKTRIVAYVEIEAFAIANLVAKMETGLLVPAPIWTNLKTFPMDSFRGVDFITAGYPCQPFSCAGQRKGTDDPRHLWPYIRRIYQTIHPRWMFFENVEGHVTLGLSTVISDLEEDGYKVEAGLFTAAEVGAPHRRKRVFILAHSNRSGSRSEHGMLKTNIFTGSSPEELAHSSRIGRGGWNQSRREVRECGLSEDQTERSGSSFEVLGDSEHDGRITEQELRSNEATSDKRREKEPGASRELEGTGRPVDVQSVSGCETGSELADPNQPGPQGRNSGIMPERAVQWPTRPGSPQYDWEEPRVVEPQVGGKPYGSYNRVDELRLLGNGVVPQQAALAYRVLLRAANKHLEA